MDYGFTHQKTLLDTVFAFNRRVAVLELGVGWFSTPLLWSLLQDGAVEEVASLEHDLEWYRKIVQDAPHLGKRWDIGTVLDGMWVEAAEEAARDLEWAQRRLIVFVDNWAAEWRGKIIRRLREVVPKNTVFIMHDAEPKDREAYGVTEMFKGGSEEFAYERIDKYAEGPWTVVWSDDPAPFGEKHV